jgi:AcrR family transcriptional regulator
MAEGARERRRRETEESLREAALHLFSERGYDETSLDEITTAAGVGRRTFFRYFTSKEDLLFVSRSGPTMLVPESAFATALANSEVADLGLSDLAALQSMLLALTPALEAQRTRLQAFETAVASSPALRGRSQDSAAFVEQWITDAFRTARGTPEATARTLARVGREVLNSSSVEWLQSSRRRLATVVTTQFRVIEEATKVPDSHGRRAGERR